MAPRGGRRCVLRYDVPVEVAYDYLADPRNRPEWQSSLRGVEMLDEGEPRVGMRWRDLTVARIRPEMVITAMEPPRLWAETGTWHAVAADLTLEVAPVAGTARSCEVTAAFEVRAGGPLAPVGWVATAAGLPAVRSDLRRAGRLLAARHAG